MDKVPEDKNFKTNISIQRLRQESKEMVIHPDSNYTANPVNNDLFLWHFTIRGPTKTDYENGIYHGTISLPYNYPFKPPSLYFLTPNGRFEINSKICLSFTSFHPESWQPAWTIRTMLEGIISYMPVKESLGAIGSLEYTSEERKKFALASKNFKCDVCGQISDLLISPVVKEEKKEHKINELKKEDQNQSFQDKGKLDISNKNNYSNHYEIQDPINNNIHREFNNMNKRNDQTNVKDKIDIIEAGNLPKDNKNNLELNDSKINDKSQFDYHNEEVIKRPVIEEEKINLMDQKEEKKLDGNNAFEKNTKLGGILSEQLANLRIILSKMYSTVFKIYDENYANLSNVDYIYKFIEYLDKVIDYLPRSKNVLAGIDTQKSLTNKSKIESAEHVNDSESEDVKKLATENSFKKILAFIKTYAQENNKSIDEIFEMFDINHDQLIDRFEFKNSLFRICKESVNYEEIENAINYLDDGGDKKINFHEFAKGLYNEFNQDKIKLGVKKRDNNAMGKLKFKISREIRAQHIQTEFELFINMIIKCKEKYTKIQLEKNSIELSEYISLLDDNQVKEFVSIIYETLRKSSSQIQFSFFEFIGVMCSNIYLLSNNTYIKIEKIEILIIELFRKITEKINIIKNNCEFEPFQLFLKTGFKILKSKKETFASNKFLIFLENYISKLIQKANLEVNDSYQKQSQKMNEEQPSENDNMKTGIRDIKSLKDAQIFIKIIEKISRASDSKQIFKYIENVIILLAMSLKKIKRNDLLEDPIVGIYFEMQVTNWILNLLRCLPLNFEFNIEAWQIIFQILCSIMVSKLQLLSNEISDNDLLILLVKCSFIFKELKERPIIALLLFNKIPLNFINEVTTFLNKQFLTNINPNLTNFNYGVYCYYPETNEHKNHMNCAIDKCQLNYISSYGQYQILISFNLYIAFVSSLESPENSLMSSENEFIREILKMKKKKDFRRSLTLKTVHNISENFENQNENNSNCFISMLNKIFCCCSCCKRKNNQVTYADPEEGTSTARNFLIPIAPETNITITKNELTESKNQSAFRQESLNPEVSKFFKENLIEMFINSSEKINVQVPLLYSTIRDEKWKKGYASLNSDEAHPNGKNNLDFCEIKPIEDRLYSHINYYKSINKNMGSCIKCFKLNDLLKYFFYFILFAQIISFSITWNNDVRFLNCNQIHWIIQNIFCSFQIIILVWILISYFIINFRWIFSNVTNILKINQRKQSEIPPKTEEINNSNCLTIVNKIFRNSFIRICIISFFLSIGSFIYLPLSIFSIYFTLSFVEIIIFRSIHLEQFFKLFILIIQFYCIGSLYVIFLNGYIKNAQSLFLKDCTNLVECSVESIFGVLSLHSFISITNIESKDKIYAGIIILNGLLTVFVIYYSYKIFIEVIQILILLFGNKQSKRKMFETYYLNLKIEKLNKELSQDYIKRRKYLFFSLMKPKKECSRLDRDIRKKFKFITN